MDANKIREIRIIRENPRFRHYPEYKESGVEWIGEIPKGWEVLKVKHVGYSNPSKTNPKTACLKDTLVVFLPMERVHTDGTIDQELRLPYSQLKNGYTYFEENDVLIAKVTPCFENGKIVLIKDLATPVGFGSTEFIVIRPKTQKVFPRFLFYLLYNESLRSIGKHFMASAVGLKRVPTEFVENFQIPIPTKQEQVQIVKFLDRKTEQIDELIRLKERRIELLQAQRTALINQAVTKGLDPNVEMKPSGVEWIAEIPGHWEVINTKYLFRLVTEPAPKNNDYELLSIYTNIGVKPRKELEARGNRATTTDGYWLVKKGDFIVNKLLAWMGAIGLSNYEGVTSPAYDILRKSRPLNERFYEYVFRCGLYFTEFKKRSRGIMEVRLRLYFDQFGQIPLVFPPVDEQDKIVNSLDCKTEQIDELIAAELRKIELLKEYRQSLISEAVTGKIDVRNEV